MTQASGAEKAEGQHTETADPARLVRDPLVSVVMVTYNHQPYVAQAIEGVISQQTRFALELIIGEDCSTDRTREIVVEYQRRYPERIRVLTSATNVGAHANSRRAMQAARGKYMAFCEGDDYWISSDKIQKQVDFLERHPDCAICSHRARVIHEMGFGAVDFPFDVFPPSPAGLYTIFDILKTNFISSCSTVVRRDLIGPYPTWILDVKFGDWPLWAMIARYGTIQLMDDVMAAYRVHPGGVWSAMPSATRLREVVRLFRALDGELGSRYTRKVRETIAEAYLGLASISRSEGRRIETGKHLVSCMRNGGLHLPANRRAFAGLAAYIFIGSGYKVFSRAKSANSNRA
jgi:glycosyltransferase involved in cell wall biosynthesis